MEWDRYEEQHAELQRGIAQACVIAHVAEAALDGFPSNIPRGLASPLAKTLQELGEATLQAANAAREGSTTWEQTFIESPDPLGLEVLLMLVPLGGRRTDVFDFAEAVRRQHLVTMLAALDAFLAESIRAVCRRQPNVMRSAKTLTHEDVIAAGSYEALIETLVDRFAFEAGWGPLRDRLFLPKALALAPAMPPDVVELADRADTMRNLIMHAGGIVSREACARARDLPAVGQPLAVSRAELGRIAGVLRHAGYEVFAAVAEKFYGRSRDTLRIRVYAAASQP